MIFKNKLHVSLLIAAALFGCKRHGNFDHSNLTAHSVNNGGDMIVLTFKKHEESIINLIKRENANLGLSLDESSIQKYQNLGFSVVSSDVAESGLPEVDAEYDEASNTIKIYRARWMALDVRGQRIVVAHQVLNRLGINDEDGSLTYRVVVKLEKYDFATESKPMSSEAKNLQDIFYSSSTKEIISKKSLHLKKYWSCKTISADGNDGEFYLRFFDLSSDMYTVSQRAGFNSYGSWSSFNAEKLRAPLGVVTENAIPKKFGIELNAQGNGDIGSEVYQMTKDGKIVFETSVESNNPDVLRKSKIYDNQVILYYGICSSFHGEVFE